MSRGQRDIWRWAEASKVVKLGVHDRIIEGVKLGGGNSGEECIASTI